MTTDVTIEVCTACIAGPNNACSGQLLLARLAEACRDNPEIRMSSVDCFAVCERPLTIAFRAAGKWSYLLGDIPVDVDPETIINLARAIAASPHGIPAMADRPDFFRNSIICRIPPEPGPAGPS